MRAEEQIGQRRSEIDDARHAVEEVQHRVEVAQPLRQFEPATQQGVVDACDLRHAARPADALRHVAGQAFGGQARGLRHGQVGGAVTAALQLERGVRIFGDRFHRHAAHFFQRGALDDRTRTTEERGIPLVVAILQQAVEQLAFVGHLAMRVQVAFERVRRKEIVRHLHQCQLGVVQEPAHRHLQKTAGGNVVAIEDGHIIAAALLQRGIDVAGLGMRVIGAGDVVDADLGAERAKLVATAVVQQMDGDLAGRPIDHAGRQHGGAHHRQRLVVGRDEHVHAGPQALVGRQRHRLAVERPQHLEIAQHQDHEGIQLGAKQAQAEDEIHRAAHAHGLGHAPPDVTARHR